MVDINVKVNIILKVLHDNNCEWNKALLIWLYILEILSLIIKVFSDNQDADFVSILRCLTFTILLKRHWLLFLASLLTYHTNGDNPLRRNISPENRLDKVHILSSRTGFK